MWSSTTWMCKIVAEAYAVNVLATKADSEDSGTAYIAPRVAKSAMAPALPWDGLSRARLFSAFASRPLERPSHGGLGNANYITPPGERATSRAPVAPLPRQHASCAGRHVTTHYA